MYVNFLVWVVFLTCSCLYPLLDSSFWYRVGRHSYTLFTEKLFIFSVYMTEHSLWSLHLIYAVGRVLICYGKFCPFTLRTMLNSWHTVCPTELKLKTYIIHILVHVKQFHCQFHLWLVGLHFAFIQIKFHLWHFNISHQYYNWIADSMI